MKPGGTGQLQRSVVLSSFVQEWKQASKLGLGGGTELKSQETGLHGPKPHQGHPLWDSKSLSPGRWKEDSRPVTVAAHYCGQRLLSGLARGFSDPATAGLDAGCQRQLGRR